MQITQSAIRKASGGQPSCDKHPDRLATLLYLDTGKALCPECRKAAGV